jgi:hypothetical protein
MIRSGDEEIHCYGMVAVPKPWVKDWMLAVLTLALGDTLPTRQPSQAMSPRLGSVKAAPTPSPPPPG